MESSARLKIKGDTFFLPDQNGGVYFRNNVCSFRLEGKTIYQWVEKLIPMFNGEHSLATLTDGLPEQYANQVNDIARILLQKGFARDVSQDQPHNLSKVISNTYISQIEFLDNLKGSGAYRFRNFRQTKALAVGSGSFFVSLVAALLETGLPKFNMLITDFVQTNRDRLSELEIHAHTKDPEVVITEISPNKENSWREIIQSYEAILYISEDCNMEELRILHSICKEEKKLFIPAICFTHIGLAGPLVFPNTNGCWESAWHRLHQVALQKERLAHPPSHTAKALLANILAFELFKQITGITERESTNKIYLLDLETLEGSWHSFVPHPLITGQIKAQQVQINSLMLETKKLDKKDESRLLSFFNELTSKETGIFHTFGAEDAQQLPLAQCQVKVADPLSIGPARLLPEIISTSLTHENARREAGLSGLEAYVSKMIELDTETLFNQQIDSVEFIGVGTGESVIEGVTRGLQKCLTNELQQQQRLPFASIKIDTEDTDCQFYLKALTTLEGPPSIYMGETIAGFPVIGLHSNRGWYTSIGFNQTLALRDVLKQALTKAQHQTTELNLEQVIQIANEESNLVSIKKCKEETESKILQSAMQTLQQNGKKLIVFRIEIEPFFEEALSGVFAVVLRGEGSK